MIWRGETYDVDLGQPVGHEPAVRRPAVVVSVDVINKRLGKLVLVVPVPSAAYGLRSHARSNREAAGWPAPPAVVLTSFGWSRPASASPCTADSTQT